MKLENDKKNIHLLEKKRHKTTYEDISPFFRFLHFTIREKLFQNNNGVLGSKRDNKYHNNNRGVDNAKARKGYDPPQPQSKGIEESWDLV